MKIIAVNGSPRKKWNTARLLDKALEGAALAGASTKRIDLYDLSYHGCSSCFACKLLGGPSYGRCAMKDDLRPVLAEIAKADGLILGSPIYLFAESGQMRSFMERLCFPYLSYTDPPMSLFPRSLKSALIYTMNIDRESMAAYGLDLFLNRSRTFMELVFGHCEMFLCTDTLQFSDYAKYESARFDSAAKLKRHRDVFPQDENQALALGRRLASGS